QQEKDSTLFSFFKESILMLNEMNKNVANFHLLFMIKLTNFLGFAPMSM
ncbi:MAG TPA: DNA repair protein RecO, partial [Porphyromonadaceae bacterium]|nr:DNA repair protein RecO [Porphyromonadaceae bacterium]